MDKSCILGVSFKSCMLHALPTLAVLAAWRWAQLQGGGENDAQGPLVRVEQGLLLGAHRTTHHDGIPYFSFQGIPYAKPPVGNLRFRAPLPPDNWTDVRPALEEGHMCCQPHTDIYWMPPEIHKMYLPSLRRAWLIVSSLPRLWSQIRRFWAQQEDCLYLNVYTKQIPLTLDVEEAGGHGEADEGEAASKLSPVLVFIHGGAFYSGTANSHIYGPDFLLREDVVLVTIQYRLGALGFLAAGYRDVPGNAGLKDQAEALRWVQRNIARFGGDPGRVALVGHSAGGASVHYHTLSRGSRGLFHRAVHLSGTAFNAWAYVSPEGAKARAQRLAYLLGCPADQCSRPDDLVSFLRTKEPRQIIDASYKVFDQQETAAGYIAPFVPTVDGAYLEPNDTLGNVFLQKEPFKAMEDGDFRPVPTLVGQNSMEGMIVLLPDVITDDMTPSPSNLAKLEEDFERVVPLELGLVRGSDNSRLVADMMRKHYFEGKAVSQETIRGYLQIYSDLLFTIGIGRYIRVLTKLSTQPTFVYHFSFDGKLSVVKKLVRAEMSGVSHGDELGYMFPVEMMPAEDVRPGDVDLLVRDRWTRLLSNFASYGAPTAPNSTRDQLLNVLWAPSTSEAPQYVDIGAEMSNHKGLPLQDAHTFWQAVYSTVGKDICRG